MLKSSLRKYWPLGLALICGLAARIWCLSAHSLLLDEATVAVGARDILRNHTPMWDAMSNAPFVWIVAQMLGMSGLASDFFVRLPSALIGTASIICVYFLAKRMFNRTVASMSAIIFALHPVAVVFSRVLFADPFQVFFIIIGCYAFDSYATQEWSIARRDWRNIALIFCFWAAAFVMKYNAVVPGALWLASGVLSRRYKIGPAFTAFAVMTAASIFTLLLWPYDAPIWLAAFLEKAGKYNLPGAVHYFSTKSHLVFFSTTEIVLAGGVVMAFVLRGARGKAIGQLVAFVLLYFATIIILGRTFERYLLIATPFGCILFAAILENLPHIEGSGWNIIRPFRLSKIIGSVAVGAVAGIFAWGLIKSYANYIEYLHNEVDRTQLTKDVISLEQDGRLGFWLTPEPIATYYLGFTQRYSRANRPGLDGTLARQNYFEFASLSYADDGNDYTVLEVRRMASRWGLIRILSSPRKFLDSAKIIAKNVRAIPNPPAIDYMTSDFVRKGDLLIMQGGMTDVQCEPILEDLWKMSGPPLLPTLPLDRFQIYRVYRPEGYSTSADTTISKVRAGVWLMIKK